MPRFTFWPLATGHEIRMIRMGCKNRPFYIIGAIQAKLRMKRWDIPDEVLGSYDPMLTVNKERLASIDLERLSYWIGQGAKCDEHTKSLLGLIGFLPISPTVYQVGWKMRRRKWLEEQRKARGEPPEDLPLDPNKRPFLWGHIPVKKNLLE